MDHDVATKIPASLPLRHFPVKGVRVGNLERKMEKAVGVQVFDSVHALGNLSVALFPFRSERSARPRHAIDARYRPAFRLDLRQPFVNGLSIPP